MSSIPSESSGAATSYDYGPAYSDALVNLTADLHRALAAAHVEAAEARQTVDYLRDVLKDLRDWPDAESVVCRAMRALGETGAE
jgi:hypothetical protein